jgi:hypothetical protein
MSTSSIVSVNLLKPHPKNKEYYGDLDPAKYEELKRSMSVHGIRDSLKVLPDFTVIAGHQRLKIALELGIEKVPVKVEDLPESQPHPTPKGGGLQGAILTSPVDPSKPAGILKASRLR